MRPDLTGVGSYLELKNLVAALVLGACDEGERALARAHLESCRTCVELTRRLAETVEVVPIAVRGVRPPANLRGRILYASWPQPSRTAMIQSGALETGSG